MRFHWQNLNDKPGERQGSLVRNGRAWWHFSDRGVVGWQWVFFQRALGASFGFEASDGTGLKFSIQLAIFSLYVHAHGGLFAWLALKILPCEVRPHMIYGDGLPKPDPSGKTWKLYGNREISVRIYDWSIWWELWRDPMGGWPSRDPSRWRSSCFHPLDFLLGKQKYSDREIKVIDAVVPMPERSYPCTIRLHESMWRRPRWPIPIRVMRATIDVEKNPIPFPGKGENSWDCGEDATHSMTTTASTPEEAIAAMVESVMNKRRRHGGSVNWKPAAIAGQA